MMLILKKFFTSIILFLVIFCFINVGIKAQGLKNPFFVFNNCLRGGPYNTPEKKAALLDSLGYDGMEGYNVFKKNGIDNLVRLLKALDEHDLKLYTIYIHINLDDKQSPYDPRLKKVFSILQGRDTTPWFVITSKKYKPSSVQNDSIAVPVLQEIADMAHTYGLNVMIYPHKGMWVQSVEDAIRVTRKVNRRNLGFTFNLPHYLAGRGMEADQDLQPLIGKAMPYLFAISLNGADEPANEIMKQSNLWNHFIKPLGEGSYDVFGFLHAFVSRGFQGPVGLQCYGISEDDKVHLKKSMETWKLFQKRITQ